MRRMRVIGSAVGLLVIGSACATTTGVTGASLESARPQVTRLTRAQQIAWRDSTYAQAIADMEGPGASIRAEFSNVSGSRRVRAVFDLQADAYVVVGHIDAEGVLRIVFPVDPAHDDGFVKGSKTYRSTEFFAGFTDTYRHRAQQGFYRGVASYDSYDAGLGYMFIIASWRPMRFDRFATENQWDTFELADDRYMSDPRPAIYELASLLVGENREEYTVKLARYTNSTSLYGMNSGYDASAYGMRYCAGFQPLGFAFDPFSSGQMFNSPMTSYTSYGTGYAFTRRGVNYYYDSFGDCYTTGYPGLRSPYGGYGYRIAGGPEFYNPNNPTPRRGFNPEGPRVPFAPRVAAAHSAPTGRAADVPEASPTYRQRGLITSNEPGVPERRGRNVEGRSVAGAPSRPSIQEMVTRREVANSEAGRASNGYSRAQGYQRSGNSSSTGSSQNERRSMAPRDYDSRATSQSFDRGFTPSSSAGGASSSAPTSSSSAPTSSAPPASSSAPPASSSAGSSGRPGTP